MQIACPSFAMTSFGLSDFASLFSSREGRLLAASAAMTASFFSEQFFANVQQGNGVTAQ
jgi:hypothetical protein